MKRSKQFQAETTSCRRQDRLRELGFPDVSIHEVEDFLICQTGRLTTMLIYVDQPEPNTVVACTTKGVIELEFLWVVDLHETIWRLKNAQRDTHATGFPICRAGK